EPGWDSRPWHGDEARVRTGRDPQKFQAMLERAKEFVEERTPPDRPKIVLVEAWNEFGEGAAIEPHRAWGFGYLDAIRTVFTDAPAPHVDVTPADVELELKEWQAPPRTLEWSFEVEGDLLGWYTQHINGFTASGGALKGTASSSDPGFYTPRLSFQAAEHPVVEITMKTDAGSLATLYWATAEAPMSEQNSLYFPVTADGRLHTYRLELSRHPFWRGEVVQLRIDPNNVPGSHIEIDAVRVLSR
ncbi:MAG TPA: glycoside hydrolase family 99-like domain-containing protein, partial [Limnochordia bacterium]